MALFGNSDIKEILSHPEVKYLRSRVDMVIGGGLSNDQVPVRLFVRIDLRRSKMVAEIEWTMFVRRCRSWNF
jgi:hypothetical protein